MKMKRAVLLVRGWPTFGPRESAPVTNVSRVTTGGAPRLAVFETWDAAGYSLPQFDA
jgi:hypothetical protein